MGGLDSAAAAVTTTARLVVDAYMAAPADVAAAPATTAAAIIPVSRMEFISRNKLVWTLSYELVWTRLELVVVDEWY